MAIEYLVPMLVTDDSGKSEIVFAAPSGKWYRADGTETESKGERHVPQEVALPTEVIQRAKEVVNNA